MQALGSYRGGKMLFLGLGTGLGSTLIAGGSIEPMELGHVPYKKSTNKDYVGKRALEKRGKKTWRRHVEDVVADLIASSPTTLVHDHFSAGQGVEDDHRNVLCLGGRTMGPAVAWDLVQTFLAATFSQAERHLRPLSKTASLEGETDERRASG
jgi:hypothetical protein